ncbi:endo-1,4-beta-xylanase [Nocardia arthritidis]|uniref:Beta-xylanase n=1 Tax=Nocardia arthritidis TaxID=228602 RepID=A0A6G9Y8N7_9NOCA|nr:endo-1,4-beta-xylanase [Nocardia arthritidis]QIS09423.1 glycosyl hydrolase [Nocardia arthritidis]
MSGSRRARAALVVAGAVLVAAGGVACADQHADAAAAVKDLLHGHDWTHFAGAEVGADGLRITPLDRKIVRQDGSGGQPNPPVNLRGPRLRIDGDFEVTATMRDIGSRGAYLQLYSGVPVVYDEWRYEPPSLRFGIAGGKLQVAVWDGRADRPAQTRSFGADLAGAVTVTVRTDGNIAVLSVDGKEVGSVPDGDIFDGATVWFGADAELGGGWTLTSLTARPEPGRHLSVLDSLAPQESPGSKSLRVDAAKLSRPFEMGTALASGPLASDAAYRAFAAAQYGMFTPENDFKPQFLQPRRGVFAFAEADGLIDFARANAMKVHGHTLVWHEALPQWMRKVSGPDAVRQTMFDHIDAVAGHFRGQVAEWDVVNEPISDDPADYANGNNGIRSGRNIWFQALGEQYIDEAFRRVRAMDPDAKLYINEYGVEADGRRWDALLALVTRLKERGVPIDGVGFQGHEYTEDDRISGETFRKHVRALAALGMQSRVSEMDVLVEPDEHDIQAKQFAERLAVCKDEPSCTSFSTWGFTDKYGSTATPRKYPVAPADALPIDARMRPKPAYSAMLAELPG